MREIKFRAWAYKRFYTEGFVIYPSGATEWPESGWDLHGVDDKIKIEQFTGLHDKNGAEIYEGDILYNPADRDGYHEVIWSEYNCAWCLGDEESYPMRKYQPGTFWSVIGNIHETPELLNGAH